MKKGIGKKMGMIAFSYIICGCMLTGCGTKGGETTTSSVEGETVGTESSIYSDEEVSLDFECIWVGTDSKAEYFGSMVDGFNEQYAGKYHINLIEQTDYDTYESKLKVQISAGQVPDIFTVKNYSDVQSYAETGNLMDFTQYLTDDDIASRFNDGVIDEYKIDDKTYCIPYETGVVPIMYNKEILDAAGVIELPTSWDEFFAVCDKVSAMGISPTSFMTGGNAWTAQLWFSYALASVAGPDAWSKDITSEEYKEAAEIVKRIYSYAPTDSIGAEAGVVNGHFYNKEAAIYTNGTWILGGIKLNAGQDFYNNVAVSSGLSYNGENGNSFINYVQAFLCAAKQENPDKQAGIEAFFDYITNLDNVTGLAEASGSTFCLNLDTTKLTDALQAEIISKCKNASFTIKSFGSSVPASVTEAFPSAIESFVTGETDAQGFVDELAAANQ